ncbi:MAG: hypothetical protein WC635_17690 [Bacteriovorax sp.]|jgi:hypothetical protein
MTDWLKMTKISLKCVLIFLCLSVTVWGESLPEKKADQVDCKSTESGIMNSSPQNNLDEISNTIDTVAAKLPKFKKSEGNKIYGVDLLSDSGLLEAGKKIGNCKILSSKIIRENDDGKILGMEIEIQDAEKTVLGFFDSKIETSDMPLNTKRVVVESWFNSLKSSAGSKKALQYIRLENQEYKGKGVVVDLYIETKEETDSGSMKVVKDKSIRCKK